MYLWCVVKNLLNKLKNLFKNVLAFYNTYFAIINVIITVLLFDFVENKTLSMILIVICIVDCVRWWKLIVKNMGTSSQLIGSVKQNNVLAIYGGVGSGKSTIAQYLLNKLVPNDLQYTNTKTKNKKIFTNRHLLLLDSLPHNCGVLIDEAGRQYDSFKYEKSDNSTRSRIITYNKFFRQFYGSNAYCFYVDQCEANMNTALYRSIYYVIQCKGVSIEDSALIPSLIFKLLKLFKIIKKNINNPFSLVSIEYMEFLKTGEYADHYSINIEDKDHKKLVAPIQNIFGNHNTYVFREFNPAQGTDDLYWGEDELQDEFYMEQNFDLKSLKEEFGIKGLEIDKYKRE